MSTLSLLAPVFAFSQQKKKTEKYECTGPACSVPNHNHKFKTKRVSLSHKSQAQSPIRLRHKNVNDLRNKNIQVNHDYMNRKVLRLSGIRHNDLEKKPFPLFKNRHESLNNKQQKILTNAHRSIDQKRFPLFQSKHKSMENYSATPLKVRHKDLNSSNPFQGLKKKQILNGPKSSVKDMANANYPTFRLRHQDLSQVCNQKIVMRRRNVNQSCSGEIQISHKDLGMACSPRIKISHRDLQSKCYPSPKIKHKNLSAECMPRYRVKHKYPEVVCYIPTKVEHRSLNQKCYPVLVIRHKNMEGLSCTEVKMKHNDPARFRIPCDPNMQQPTSTLERIGKEIKYWFTFHRRYCELEARYSGVTEGCVVETTHGTAVVTDIVVKKNLIYPSNMVVAVAKVKNNEPTIKLYKIDKIETKEIMIYELIKRQKYVWLVRMYPEERTNLNALRELYGDPTYRPIGVPPSGDPSPVPIEGN